MDTVVINFTKVVTRKGVKAIHAYHVEVTPSELTEAHKASRWYAQFGHLISQVSDVRVAIERQWDDTPVDFTASRVVWSTYKVVKTPFGQACIVDYEGHSEVAGVIGDSGIAYTQGMNKPPVLTLETWRKYGVKRGWGMPWLRAMHARGLCSSPEKGRDAAPIRAYRAMAGEQGCFV